MDNDEKIGISLKEYLNELSQKYRNKPLSPNDIALFDHTMAHAIIFQMRIQEKNKIDIKKNPKEYLLIEKELDEQFLPKFKNVIENMTINLMAFKQLLITDFIEEIPDIFTENQNESISAKIKVHKKGLNGHN